MVRRRLRVPIPFLGNIAALLWALFLFPPGRAGAQVVISEFMADNVFTLEDNEGDNEDWIELYNPSSTETVDLSGWYLTDDARDPRKWRIPDGLTLPPQSYLVVFASGKDQTGSPAHLHTNFRLSSQGEYLAVVGPDGRTPVFEFEPAYPLQFEDTSYGVPAGGGEPTYLAEPTPGRPNSGPAVLGPAVLEVTHAPQVPSESDDIVVTARILPIKHPVLLVQLFYRVQFEPEEGPIAMRDDGEGADSEAGDNIYTAVIPAGTADPGQMIRWYIVAYDAMGETTRSPRFARRDASPEYYGTVVEDPALDTPLPVFWWFIRPGTESSADTRTGTRASVFFLGEFYDNVFVRVRGGTTARLRKKSYKFDFNPRHHFRFVQGVGRVEEINLNTTYTDKSYVRQQLAFEVFDAAGAPGSIAFNVRVQRNGAFFSVATLIEQPDKDLLRREGLSDRGALYKMYNACTSGTSGVRKRNRRYENNADLVQFVQNINSRSGESLKNYLFDNVDLPRTLNYLAANVITQNNDCMKKNYYLYRDSEGSGRWLMLPWDLDLTFGRHFMTDDSILGDTIWADKDWILGGASRNVPISPSHPFMGKRELPGNRSWNRFINALLSVPEIRAMFRRRLWTVMEETIGSDAASSPLGQRLEELRGQLAADGELDRSAWGQYGQPQTLDKALEVLRRQYLEVRRRHLFVTHLAANAESYPEPRAYSAELPGPPAAPIALRFASMEISPPSGNQDEEYIELVNDGPEAVDLSGWKLTGAVEYTFLPGTVLLPGASLFVTPDERAFRARSSSPKGGEGLFVQGDYSGHLSNLGETLCLLDPSGATVLCEVIEGEPNDLQRFLRVTEIHYHPLPPTKEERAAGFSDADDFEFIELCNVSTDVTLDLTGVRFTQGIEFDFTASPINTLSPGQCIVLVSNEAAFEMRYGSGFPVAGSYAPFHLENAGEVLKIEDPQNNTIQEFRYGDDPAAGWPQLADGMGPSLEVVDVNGDYDLPSNWRLGPRNGTPGLYKGLAGSFVRGDANADGGRDIADAVFLLGYLFAQGEKPPCAEAGDANDDGKLDVSDAIALLRRLFGPVPSLPDPDSACGVDPTPDALGCLSFPPCR